MVPVISQKAFSLLKEYGLQKGNVVFNIRQPVFPAEPVCIFMGSSGSGKSVLLSKVDASPVHLYEMINGVDQHTCVFDVIDKYTGNAELYLRAAGVNSLRTWVTAWGDISCGEKYRCYVSVFLSYAVQSCGESYKIDEWCSDLDDEYATSISFSVLKFWVSNIGSRLVLGTSRDVSLLRTLNGVKVWNTDMGCWLNSNKNIGNGM